jgi:hypothetical protein
MACLIGTLVWLSIIFGGLDKAPIGVPATILGMWFAMEAGSLIGMPLGLARAAKAANASEVQVDDEGLTIKSGRNVRFLPWTTLSAIWIYDDFILLPLGPLGMSRFVWVPRAGMSAEVLAAFQGVSERLSNSSAATSARVR